MKTKKLLSAFLSLILVLSMVMTLGISAAAGKRVTPENECWLDLDSSTTEIPEKKELDQNYNLKVSESVAKADEVVTKVKLSWEITDINATRTDSMVWDTEELCWKAGSSAMTVNKAGTAKFTLENYSSVKVNATATFDAVKPFAGAAAFTESSGKANDGIVTLDTANGNSSYSKSNVPTEVIRATVTPAESDFDGLSATTAAAKYGVYTVTLSEVPAGPVAGATFRDGTTLTWDEVLKEENATKYGYRADLMDGTVFTTVMGQYGILEASAFYNCDELVSIVVPAYYTSISQLSFNYCSNLESVVFLGETTELLSANFQHCSKLTSVVLPQKISVLSESLFNCIENMPSIDIPVSVTEIKNCVFNGAKNLTINYAGTRAQWDAITKTAGRWNDCANIKVVCTDDSYTPISRLVVTGSYSATVAKNGTTSFSVSEYPAVNDESGLLWSSTDDTVATVDQTGLVTAKSKAGTVTITCVSKVRSNIKKTFTVTVPKDTSDYMSSACAFSDRDDVENISLADAYSLAKALATSTSKKVYVVYYMPDGSWEEVLYACSDDASATEHSFDYYDFVDDGKTPVTDASTEALYVVSKS